MVGGSPKRFLHAGLWVAALLASGAHAASDSDSQSARSKAVALTAPVMAASFYGMEEAPRGDALLQSVMLDAHNGERTALGLDPLDWDDDLAADAARYAQDMARTGLFRHSPRASRTMPSGENLWMGPRRLYDYGVMVSAFLEERKLMRAGGKLPDLSTTGRWQDVGHYSQMIWRGTRRVGCALGDGANYEYLVCRYFPAGNAFGKGPMDMDDTSAPTQLASGGQ